MSIFHSDTLKLRDIYFGSIDSDDELNKDGGNFLKKVYRSFGVFHKITNDNKIFIIGKKGHGKTTVANMIKANKSDQDYIKKIKFSSNKIEQITQAVSLEGDQNRLEYLWEWILLCILAEMVSESHFLNLHRQQLKSLNYFVKQNRGLCDIDALEITNIVTTTGGNVSIKNLLGLIGAEILTRKEKATKKAHYTKVVPRLKQWLIENILNSEVGRQNKYFVIVDDLDDDYKDNEFQRHGIASLLRKSRQLFYEFKEKGIHLYPVVLIRNDMLNKLVNYSDGRKFGSSGNGYEINWYIQDNYILGKGKYFLREMVSSRIEYAYEKKGIDIKKEIMDGWTYISKSEQFDLFKYLLNKTRYCPRDVIAYLNLIRDTYPNQSKIDKNMIDSCFNKFCKDTYIEWRNEISGFLSEEQADTLFKILQRCPSPFNFEDFLNLMNVETEFAKDTLDMLYEAGCICNDQDFNYSYRSDSEKLNKDKNMKMHTILENLWDLRSGVA